MDHFSFIEVVKSFTENQLISFDQQAMCI